MHIFMYTYLMYTFLKYAYIYFYRWITSSSAYLRYLKYLTFPSRRVYIMNNLKR